MNKRITYVSLFKMSVLFHFLSIYLIRWQVKSFFLLVCLNIFLISILIKLQNMKEGQCASAFNMTFLHVIAFSSIIFFSIQTDQVVKFRFFLC